jgi:hypothetical protein
VDFGGEDRDTLAVGGQVIGVVVLTALDEAVDAKTGGQESDESGSRATLWEGPDAVGADEPRRQVEASHFQGTGTHGHVRDETPKRESLL